MAKYQDEVSILISARNEATAQLKAAEAEQLALARTQEQQAAAKAAQARELAQVETEIRDRVLRHTGQVLQADLEQNTAAYNARIRAAVNANQLELANRLATLREIREAEIRASDIQQKQNQQPDAKGLANMLGRATAIAAAGRALRGLTEALIDARDADLSFGQSLELITNRTFKSIPLLGQFVQAGENIRELFTGERAELAKLNAEMAERNAQMDRNNQLIEQSRQAQQSALEAQRDLAQQRDLLAARPEDRSRLQLVQQEADEIRQIEQRLAEQRLRDRKLGVQGESDAAQAIADELVAAREVAQARLAEFDREQAKMAEQAQQARVQASADADAEILALRLSLHGDTLNAELTAIRQEFGNRIQAAREANQEELADRLAMLQSLREAEAQANEARRQDLEQIDQQRDVIDDEIKALSEDLARARSRNTPSTLPVADQNRFLTGVREKTQEQDRANQSAEQQQIKAMDDQLKELKDMKEALAELVQTIQKSPVIIAGGGL
jgi:DNA repair exonuclease SbcCD ATPase subunit